MTTANTTITVQCEWIKIIPIFVRLAKYIIFLVCRRILVISLCVLRLKKKVGSHWSRPNTSTPLTGVSQKISSKIIYSCHCFELSGKDLWLEWVRHEWSLFQMISTDRVRHVTVWNWNRRDVCGICLFAKRLCLWNVIIHL